MSQEGGEEKTQDKNRAGRGQKAASPDRAGRAGLRGDPGLTDVPVWLTARRRASLF